MHCAESVNKKGKTPKLSGTINSGFLKTIESYIDDNYVQKTTTTKQQQ